MAATRGATVATRSFVSFSAFFHQNPYFLT
jgi:hypothetical protein